MQKILITGGAGFIGSAVIAELQKSTDELFVLDNLSFGRREFISVPDDHFFEIDLRNEIETIETVRRIRPDIIVHLAAIHFIPYCNEHPFEASQVNILGTAHLLKAAKISGAGRVFFASTAAVYPVSDGALDESHPAGPMDIYGLSKLTGEHLCNEFFLETGTPVVICRFFNAFGPNETNPHLIPEIQKQINSGVRKIKLGNLAPKRDFIHTADMARAVRLLLEKNQPGITVYNLGSGTEYAVTEIVEAFSRQLGEPIEIEVDSQRVRKIERMHLLADVSKLKSLGWQPQIDLDTGIQTLLRQSEPHF